MPRVPGDCPVNKDRLCEAFAALGERAPKGNRCPAPEEIWEASTGKTNETMAYRVIEHTSDCPACAEEWRLARGVATLTETQTGIFASHQLAKWVGAAAAILLLVTAIYVLEQPGSDAMRTSPPNVISSVIDGEELSRDQCVLRWSSGPAGTRYRLRVLTDDAVEVASADGLTANSYRIASDALRMVEPGGQILWRVQARFPDGRRTESVTFINTIP